MKLKHAYILCLCLFVMLCFFLPGAGHFDTHFWVNWSVALKTTGLAHAYTIHELNYNPVYLYVLRAYAAAMPNAEAIANNIHYLKIFTLLFDIGAVMLLMWWANKHGRTIIIAFFVLFNIAYLYNTLFWGQIDAIHTTLVFAAFVLAFEEKLVWSAVIFLIALNTKTQAILFLPVLGLIWLPLLKGNGKTIAKGLIVLITLQVLIILPFLLKDTAGNVWNNYVGVVDYNKALSMHAYNFWYLILWENSEVPRDLPDTDTLIGVTYKAWGFIMFCFASAIALIPLLLKSAVAWVKGHRLGFEQAEQFMLSAALVAVIFFFFPTQMHERYSHPALLFAGAYFVISKRWLIFLFISYAYLMNLESLDKCWELDNYKTFAFDARLISVLYAISLVYGTYRLYKDYGIKADISELKEQFGKKQLA